MNGIMTQHMDARIGSFRLEDITMTVEKGTVMGLLGRNGAGKTTLFRTINGTMLKTGGVLEVCGKTFETDEMGIRSVLSVVYDTMNVNPYSKGKRLLKYARHFHPSFDEAFFEEMVERFSIDLNKRVSALSLGAQKKLMLALALAKRPKVLLLDEPMIGIDPIDRRAMTDLIQAYMEDEDNTVVISSHQVEDLEKICDGVTVIDQGRVVVSQDKETLMERYVRVKGQHTVMDAESALKQGLETETATLEDIFVHLVGKERD